GYTVRIIVYPIVAPSPSHAPFPYTTLFRSEALAEVDVFLVADKGAATDELVAVRQANCERFIPEDHPYEFVTVPDPRRGPDAERDRKSTRLNSSHVSMSYAVFCLKKKKYQQ